MVAVCHVKLRLVGMPQRDLIWIWPVALALFYFLRAKLKVNGVGLVSVYLVNFGALYGIGSVVQLLPAFRGSGIKETAIGLEQSTYGLFGFLVGSMAIAPVIISQMRAGRRKMVFTAHRELPIIYLGIGFTAFLLSGVLSSVSGLTVVSGTRNDSVYSGALSALLGWSVREKGRLVTGIVLTALLPMITMTTLGFLGLGTAVAVVVLCFLTSFIHP